MSDILQFIMVNALHAAALCFLFAMLFLHSPQRRGLRLFTVLIGVAAMVLPSLLVPRTLGYPNPWPQNGVYDVLGWAANEAQGDIYLFVEQPSAPIPRHVKVPFDLDVALALEKVHIDLSVREKLSVQIQMGPGLPTPGYHLLRREQGDRSERSPRQDVFKRLATTPYHVLLAIYVGCISMMILAIFVPRRGLRAIGAIAGAVSLWLPLFMQLNTLGTPNSHPPKGDYQLLASKLSPSGESLYVFVNALEQDYSPRLYRIPFSKPNAKQADADSQSDPSLRIVRFEPGKGGDFEMFYIDYVPSDPVKGDPGVGTRYQ